MSNIIFIIEGNEVKLIVSLDNTIKDITSKLAISENNRLSVYSSDNRKLKMSKSFKYNQITEGDRLIIKAKPKLFKLGK